MQIKAAVARRFGSRLRIEALELDAPREGEILVRLVACGVGRCDLDAIAGRTGMPLPFVPGSEAAGIVEGVGAGVDATTSGDTVLVAWSACRACPACVAGDTRHCEAFAIRNLAGRRADGSVPLHSNGDDVLGFFHGQSGFATHLLCRAEDTVRVDGATPLEVAATLTGDVLTGAAGILHLRDPRAGDAIVVSGADVVGLVACMVAKARGFETIVIAERDEARRTLALEIGATIAVPESVGLAAVVKSLAPNGARFALETTGADAARHACVASLATGGTCALASDERAHAAADATDVTVISADDGIDPARLVPMLLKQYRVGALPIERLLNFFPFEQINDALAATASQAVVKAVVRFSLGIFEDLDRAKHEGAATDERAGEPTSEPAPSDVERDPVATPEVTA